MPQANAEETTPGALSNQRLDAVIGNLLRAGVVLAALVVLAGGVLFLVHQGGARRDYSTFRSEPAQLKSIAAIFRGAIHAEPASVIQFGLLLLIATPVVRVMFCVGGFAWQRDYRYVVISAIVLGVLTYSLVHTL